MILQKHFVLAVSVFCLAGCDPVYLHTTTLRLPSPPATQTTTIAALPDIAAAFLNTVAMESGYTPYPPTQDDLANGWTLTYILRYDFNGQRYGVLARGKIDSNKHQLTVCLSQFPGFFEPTQAVVFRHHLLNDARARFGPNAVLSDGR